MERPESDAPASNPPESIPAEYHRCEPTTVILIGASNLSRGLSIVFESARLFFGSRQSPISALAAIGHGRSYGSSSRVLARTLPGIVDCGLWPTLEKLPISPDNRPVALITDIGNDIIYGSSPTQILNWINIFVDRLHNCGADITITSLPIDSLQRLPRWQAKLAKLITYGGKGPTIDEALARAVEVDQRVRALADERKLHLIELKADWYGFDPIHIRKRDWPCAAAAMLAPLNPRNGQSIAQDKSTVLARGSLSRWLRLRTAIPQNVKFAGVRLGQSQPARSFPDGSALSLY